MVQPYVMAETNGKSGNNSSKLYIPWGVIIAGVAVSVSYVTLFNMLGVGIGLITFDANKFSALKLGGGAVSWFSISGIVAMWIGAWFVGKFSSAKYKLRRACYGMLVWSLNLIFTVMIASTASGVFMGGVINLSDSSIVVVAKTVSEDHVAAKAEEARSEVTVDNDEQQIKQQVEDSANTAGKISVFMFIAFFLSWVVSIFGVVYTKPFKQR
jgi:hypothetical protein